MIQNDLPQERTLPSNYRPIMCLLLMWKTVTAKIREETYYSLINHKQFFEEQKPCYQGKRETSDILYTDQHLLKESKAKRENIAMAWIDKKKTNDMIPRSGIVAC